MTTILIIIVLTVAIIDRVSAAVRTRYTWWYPCIYSSGAIGGR